MFSNIDVLYKKFFNLNLDNQIKEVDPINHNEDAIEYLIKNLIYLYNKQNLIDNK